ncbi:hypothetical protein [Bifidobacterium canis]|uniref:hypothetical protein n=1 Tax=Bifidobacterium canis TaxID=2610880 RepID=UPI001FEC5DD7|nr:hypothetical protein [Bifidobacterium canis]
METAAECHRREYGRSGNHYGIGNCYCYARSTYIDFAIARKAIPTTIFAIATLLVFISFNSSFVPSSPYNYGFGYYLFYIAAIITVLGGIWMIVAKHQLKKA